MLIKQFTLKITSTPTDSPRVEIVKKFNNENILCLQKFEQNSHEYCRDFCTAKIRKDRRQLNCPGHEIRWTCIEECLVWRKDNVANWSSPHKMKRVAFPPKNCLQLVFNSYFTENNHFYNNHFYNNYFHNNYFYNTKIKILMCSDGICPRLCTLRNYNE